MHEQFGRGRGNSMSEQAGDMSRGAMMQQQDTKRHAVLERLSSMGKLGGGGGGGLMEEAAGMMNGMMGGTDSMRDGSLAGMTRAGGSGLSGIFGGRSAMIGGGSGTGLFGRAGGLPEMMSRGGGVRGIGGMTQRTASDEIGPSYGMPRRINEFNGADEESTRQPAIAGPMPGRQGEMLRQLARTTASATSRTNGERFQELDSSQVGLSGSSTADDSDNEKKEFGSDPNASQRKGATGDAQPRHEDVKKQEARSSLVGSNVRSEPVKSEERESASTAAEAETASSEACAVCQVGPQYFSVGKKCPHAFCVTCVQSYFSTGEYECPVCGVQNDLVGHKSTQPSNGRMLVTHDNKLKLPGHDSTSRGTIIVTYTFPAGVQSVTITISLNVHQYWPYA